MPVVAGRPVLNQARKFCIFFYIFCEQLLIKCNSNTQLEYKTRGAVALQYIFLSTSVERLIQKN